VEETQMANNNILDELKKATEQVQVIASMEVKERQEYLTAVSEQFFEFQKAVRSIVSEEAIILNNFKWEWIDKERNTKCFDYFIKCKAKLFASKYGFSKEIVEELLKTKNKPVYTDWTYNSSYYMLVPKK
jgi:hypothetical protein